MIFTWFIRPNALFGPIKTGTNYELCNRTRNEVLCVLQALLFLTSVMQQLMRASALQYLTSVMRIWPFEWYGAKDMS